MNLPIPFTSPPKPVCLWCKKPICTDPFLGKAEKGGGYTCWLCNHNRFEAAREDRQGKLNCILMACVSIVACCYLGYRHLTDPPEQPTQPTTEERIRAERLDKIDTAMEALQNERDEIDPPPEPSDYSDGQP
jgi:hypothetical protein